MNFKEYKKITDMEEFFHRRTNDHINAVQTWAKRIDEKFERRFPELLARVKDHDASKFEEPEYTPYLHITWKYREKNLFNREYKVPKEIEDQMHEATVHHVKSNMHHPEFYDESSTINKEDRDKAPDKMVDGTKMDDSAIAEMCADWLAVSSERGNSAKDWADSNVNIRWKFTKEQTDLIYNILKIEKDF